MTAAPDLASRFPEPGTIDPPSELAPPPAWLVDGRVEPFGGDAAPVTSPIAVRRGGDFVPVVVGHEAQIGEAEAMRALDAAVRAWGHGRGAWPAASPAERVAAAERFAAALEERADRIATLLMYEIGKPRESALAEVHRSVEYIRRTNHIVAELAAEGGRTFTGMKGETPHYARERRLPLGIVLCVAPFNYPVNELLTTVVPALLMGNVVIAKTPRFGALANLVAADALAECFPAGAVSLLPGDGRRVLGPLMRAVRPASAKGLVDMLAFIGSEAAAHAILGHHASPVSLHKVLGLGSKNAAVILPGADRERAVASIVKGALGFNGQRCTAEKIVFAPRAEAERWAEDIAAATSRLNIGMPWDEGVAVTPLPEPGKPGWMADYIADAAAKGARVVNPGGGEAAHTLMRPAVLYPALDSMKIFHEEQFGPLVPVAPYDDIAEVYDWQRRSPYGQQVGLWGPAADLAPLVEAFRPEVARINLNDVCQRGPDSFGFTATDKSGFGILSLRDALTTFSRPVLVQSVIEEQLDEAGG